MGRPYNVTTPLCFSYIPPEASAAFFSGSTLIGVVVGAVALGLLVLLVIGLLYRRSANAKRAAERARLEASRPRPQIEVLWDRHGIPIINPTADVFDDSAPKRLHHLRPREDGKLDGAFPKPNMEGLYLKHGSLQLGADDLIYEEIVELGYEDFLLTSKLVRRLSLCELGCYFSFIGRCSSLRR